MIRFLPDTLSDALLRFFAMAAPDANVYTEIAAPDLRFAALVLAGAAGLLAWRRLGPPRRPLAVLLLVVVASSVPWLLTSGNGRYYIPILVIVGPAVVGWISQLPLTRAFRLFLAGGLLAAQAFVVLQSSPWDSWAWLPWSDPPYFAVTAPAPRPSTAPVTYVTLSSISYSLIAPQFPPESRWINISSGGATPRDADWTQRWLAAAGPLVMVAPSLKGQVMSDGQPAPDARRALDTLMASRQLSIDPGQRCSLLPSLGLAHIMKKTMRADDPEVRQIGFWLCPLQRVAAAQPPATARSSPRADAVFARLEDMCPRFFSPGGTPALAVPGGLVRHYSNSDTRIYVLDDGKVFYKFWRSLNPVQIGTVDDVLAGKAQLDCSTIRGADRPWQTGR